MGASPSREAQAGYAEELRRRRQKAWRSERRRKEVALLPLTKAFMHHVQPPPLTHPNSLTSSSKSGSMNSYTDTSTSNASRSTRRNYCPGQLRLDAAPATLPFVQQLYDAYREPSTQFYCRKATWGRLGELPAELYYPTLESFYAATVGCYEEELYNTDEDMQNAFDQQKLLGQLRSFESKQRSSSSASSAAQPPRRPRRVAEGPQLRPTPCAICFEYPTSTIAPPLPEGADAAAGATAAATAAARSGAPHGSVVFAPYSSFMVVGFIGLVPVRRQRRKASLEAFHRPPANSVGDDGEPERDGGLHGEPAEYELVAFISKSAGEQHLGRALFHAAFLYVDQCRRAGLPGNPPLPSLRFSCFLMDVPSLCFLREVRLRCAALQWSRRLARALRCIRVAAHHLALSMDDAIATDLCAFMAECCLRLDFHPAPTTPVYCFAGFVGDAGSAVAVDESAVSLVAAIQPAPLPVSGGAEVMALLRSEEEGERLLLLSRGGVRGDKGSAGDAAVAKLVCVVGTTRLTVGTTVYPHATVLERGVDVRTGAFTDADWSVALDVSAHEEPPIDLHTPDPQDAWDYSLCARTPAASGPQLTTVVSDVLLSWSKNLYVQARVAEQSSRHWVRSYSLNHYTADRSERAPPPPSQEPPAQGSPAGTRVHTSALTAANVDALAQRRSSRPVDAAPGNADGETAPPTAHDAGASPFHMWEFEHQGRSYTIGLVPNFVRAVQRRPGSTASRDAVNQRHKSADRGRKGGVAARRCGTESGVTCAVDPMEGTEESSAASQTENSSRSNSGQSSRSGETYRTAASSHSTMSNLHLTGACRTSRQRRMFLSLGTGQVFENGVPVSGNNGGGGGGGDHHQHHGRVTSDVSASAHSDVYTPLQAGGFDASASDDAQQSRRFVNTPYEHSKWQFQSPPPLQRRLSGSVSRLPAAKPATDPASPQLQSPPLNGGYSSGTPSLHGFGAGGYSDGLVDYDPDGEPDAPRCTYAETAPGRGATVAAASSGLGSVRRPSLQQPPPPPPPPQAAPAAAVLGGSSAGNGGGGRGVLGPSRALMHSSSNGGSTVHRGTGGAEELQAMPRLPVLETSGHVQEMAGADGRMKLRWNWRGAPKMQLPSQPSPAS
ncbi:hypothetical protein NESM_000882900 [Novymonas esmeraldas]|uniref:Uncharacterized protein n=1 Tax=Novymonas esmeraldas TaxID=1808958 RepID=A0AAW0EYB7_9TRYP